MGCYRSVSVCVWGGGGGGGGGGRRENKFLTQNNSHWPSLKMHGGQSYFNAIGKAVCTYPAGLFFNTPHPCTVLQVLLYR